MFRKAKKLKDPTDTPHAYNYVLFLLGLRFRTEGEIRLKMRERGYTDTVIEEVVARLFTEHYIDDDRLAQNMLESYKQFKSYGFYKIKIKLMEKRFSTERIERILDEYFSVEDEMKVAKRWLVKEYSNFVTNPQSCSYAERQKIAKKLQSRGFRMSIISKLVFSQ